MSGLRVIDGQRERFVDRHEMAEILGVSVRTLDGFVKEDCPSETWGLRLRRFEPSKVIAWVRAREKSAA